MLCDSFPPNSQRAEVVVPAVCSLDDPAAGLFATDGAGERAFSSTANVWCNVTLPGLTLGLLIVVPFVEADVVWSPSTIAPTENDGVERLADHVLVVDVGPRQRDAERDPISVGQDVALGTELCAIRRVGSGEFPPFGAFTEALSRDAHAQSMPTCSS